MKISWPKHRILASLLFVCSLFASTVSAATFVVTKTDDTNDGSCNADCSLREAIGAANSAVGDDTIRFSSYFDVSRTILLNGSPLTINGIAGLTISGPGALLLNISGNNRSRVFIVLGAGSVNLERFAVSGGYDSLGSGAGIQSFAPTVTLTDLIVRDNWSGSEGGGIASWSNSLIIQRTEFIDNNANSDGGGIYVDRGRVRIVDSSIRKNQGRNGGGMFQRAGTMNIEGSEVRGNFGGGCLLTGSLTAIDRSTFTENIGGGLNVQNTVSLVRSTVSRNTSSTDGGGLRAFSALVLISGSTISGNSSTASGGGIYSSSSEIDIDSSVVSENSAGPFGGGLATHSPARIKNSTFWKNSANFGGGIYAAVTAELDSTTVANNSGIGIGGPISPRNTLIADNLPYDLGASVNSRGYNLIENPGQANISGNTTGNIVGQDPKIVVLGDYGGTTPTVGIHFTSPAIDRGDPDNYEAIDQRGIPRPQDGDLDSIPRADIGAFEKQVTVFNVTKTGDSADGVCDSDCSLREALSAASASNAGDKLIAFDSGVFSTPQTINLSLGPLVAGGSGIWAVVGSAADRLIIDGGNAQRIFTVNFGGAGLIGGLTIRNGFASANDGGGGIVVDRATLLLNDLILTSNATEGSGGAILNLGGSIVASDITLSNNAASKGGGGISNESGNFSIVRSTIENNQAGSEGGGGFRNLAGVFQADEVSIRNNRSDDDGGGFENRGRGSVVVNRARIHGNSASHLGGGAANFGGVTTISRSTFHHNSATSGGGISVFSDTVVASTVGLSNVTVSNNTANYDGGGIYNSRGSVTTDYSTFAFNYAGNQGGGLSNSNGTITIRNTLIATNSTPIRGKDAFGTLVSNGFNLIENTSDMGIAGSTTGNILRVNPYVGILAFNGDSIPTCALPPKSAAIDAASQFGVATDQRGVLRPKDGDSNGSGMTDIGAYERDPVKDSNPPFDFDNDGKTDVSIFRPDTNNWWISRSGNGSIDVVQFGQTSDILAAADFTGDGKTDIVVWRPDSGEWFVLRSENNSYYAFPFGTFGDIPTPGDFDGDGKSDAAIFRPSTATWYILMSTNRSLATLNLGMANGVPVVADYDGDGKTDIGQFAAAFGHWAVRRSSDNQTVTHFLGTASDLPVQGDYTGDGRADFAVWRPSTGEWFITRSENSTFYSLTLGSNGDLPIPGDYDGDGRVDTAVFRPSDGNWYVNQSNSVLQTRKFGLANDRPIPGSVVR